MFQDALTALMTSESEKQVIAICNSLDEYLNKSTKSKLLAFHMERNPKYVDHLFLTAKCHPNSYFAKSIAFPRISKFSELFEYVSLKPLHHNSADENFLSIEHARLSRHIGGKRGYSAKTGHRSRNGGAFHCPYTKPLPFLKEWMETKPKWGSHSRCFSVVERADGYLVTLHNDNCIGDYWMALIDLDDKPEDLYTPETIRLVEEDDRQEQEFLNKNPHLKK